MTILKLCYYNVVIVSDSKIPVGLSLLSLYSCDDLYNNIDNNNNNNSYLVARMQSSRTNQY